MDRERADALQRRRIDDHADQARLEKLRENDRVKVTYLTGKYSGTVWDAEIQ